MKSGDSATLSRREVLLEGIRTPPIFICGVARSGTTLLSNLLDSHTRLSVFPGETYFYRTILDRGRGAGALKLVEYVLSDRLMRWLADRYWRTLIRPSQTDMRERLVIWSRAFPAVQAKLREAHVNELLSAGYDPRRYWTLYLQLYALLADRASPEPLFFVEKTPSNERYVTFMDAEFGDTARYIHIVRDPRDVAASWLLRTEWDSADRARQLLTICHAWATSTMLASSHARYFGGRYIVIRYEDLVARTDEIMQAIADSIGIPMETGLCVQTRRGDVEPINTSYPIDVPKGEITTDQIGRYRNALSEREIADIGNLLGPQMNSCGYETDTSGDSRLQLSADTRPDGVRNRIKTAVRLRHIRAIQRRPVLLPFLRGADQDNSVSGRNR